MQLYNLFPIPLGFFNRPVTEKELSLVKNLEKRPNTGNQTSTNTFILKNMTLLHSWIEDCLAEYFKATTAPKNNISLKITQSWVNFSEVGQYHHKHAHSNSIVSGIYYIQTNPDDRVYFYRDGYQQIKILTDNWNIYNSESWWFEAEVGKLILFPSFLTHMVPTVQGEQTRISLSFNTFACGVLGEEIELTELKLEI
jgi:uncharacterized protein (TIGR02466 family)